MYGAFTNELSIVVQLTRGWVPARPADGTRFTGGKVPPPIAAIEASVVSSTFFCATSSPKCWSVVQVHVASSGAVPSQVASFAAGVVPDGPLLLNSVLWMMPTGGVVLSVVAFV